MKTMEANLKGGKYGIHIGAESYGVLGAELAARGGKVFIIADETAFSYHGRAILQALPAVPAGMSFVQGEEQKNLHTFGRLLEDCGAANLTRSDCIVAFGGGVCGDIAGFCAAVYMRGIDYYQVPTTLLAQVDSSVGGKTGVDLAAGKNLAGCFKQPRGVYIDTAVLDTLPAREVSQGKAEMIKAALIKDRGLFEKFEMSGIVTAENIAQCIRIKMDFVRDDEFDGGRRMMLNFGHTIAHAIEKKTGYGSIPHGEAVAIGMALITRISEKAGCTKKGTSERVEKILKANGLPVNTTLKVSDLAVEMANDKKTFSGMLNLVFLKEIGNAYIEKMTLGDFMTIAGGF
ncbi:MAG: 3-dehydroquinate synthase [Clostridia bacterium]|nr:3-dehydroquinate synthase [Clostridia bacterium]